MDLGTAKAVLWVGVGLQGLVGKAESALWETCDQQQDKTGCLHLDFVPLHSRVTLPAVHPKRLGEVASMFCSE